MPDQIPVTTKIPSIFREHLRRYLNPRGYKAKYEDDDDEGFFRIHSSLEVSMVASAFLEGLKANEPTGPEEKGGFLTVGRNDAGEVVVNLDRTRTGHIHFTPGQALGLAKLLQQKAREAEQFQPASS